MVQFRQDQLARPKQRLGSTFYMAASQVHAISLKFNVWALPSLAASDVCFKTIVFIFNRREIIEDTLVSNILACR